MGKWGIILLTALLCFCLCACGEVCEMETQDVLPVFYGEALAFHEEVTFPKTLANGLVAEALTVYRGEFWEDGSGEYVSGVAALMLKNTGTRMLEFASVTVEQEGKILHFFIYDLPPGERCLVAERLRQSHSDGSAWECSVGILRWCCPEMSREEVDYVGTDERLTVVNRTSQIRNIKVRYKRYDENEKCFVGGMAFSAHFFAVKPQQPKTGTPEYYHAGHARVVSVSTEE